MAFWPTHRAKAQTNRKIQLAKLKRARRARRLLAGGKRV